MQADEKYMAYCMRSEIYALAICSTEIHANDGANSRKEETRLGVQIYGG